MCYHVLECIILFKALSLLIAQAKLYTSNYLNVYDMLNVSEYIQQHWNVQLKSEQWLLHIFRRLFLWSMYMKQYFALLSIFIYL